MRIAGWLESWRISPNIYRRSREPLYVIVIQKSTHKLLIRWEATRKPESRGARFWPKHSAGGASGAATRKLQCVRGQACWCAEE